MFIKFSVSNFKSFYRSQEVSMVAYKASESADRAVSFGPGLDALVKVAAVYGANASGKSNFLHALTFFQNAVRESQRLWEPSDPIPLKQFALQEVEPVPTRMCLDFLLDGVRHQYGFTVLHDRFLSEWLHVFPNARKQVWFERSDGGNIHFGQKLGGPGMGAINRTIETLVRSNSLLLSAAVQNNYQKLKAVYDYIAQAWIGLVSSSRDLATGTATLALTNPNLRKRLNELITAADLGILDYEVLEEEFDEPTRQVIQAMVAAMPEKTRASLAEIPMKTAQLRFAHALGSGRRVVFSSSEESAGTVAYFGLLGPISTALDKGGFLFVDEIESSLHPRLVMALINLFTDPQTNHKNAQLLFTTHQSSLLADGTLRRDEVWITEKDANGMSTLVPLTDFHLRKDERILAGYSQGRFGGVPNLSEAVIARAFHPAESLEDAD